MFEISKVFEFSAAHSVHSQRLKPEWAGSSYPKCRRLPGHGHNYRLEVFLRAESLDSTQMVTDFGHLKWLKEFIDDCFDHKLLVGTDDPAFELLFGKLGYLENGEFKVPYGEATAVAVNRDFKVESFKVGSVALDLVKGSLNFLTFNGYTPKEESPLSDFYQRLTDGIALFCCSPTSENLAWFFYNFVNANIEPLGVICSKVAVYETPTSCAVYGEL
ncbi:6-carboxytetrahydropterin synthase [Thermovibrio ammonificans]|jgi:6-pyruvoyltetrahydropterin/6-carboxytetrahydropterin synthase|uniref:6-carboxy-5,6,7,8-tetrahydropterin synthase n=1 Tax=Thermovibrio ammonificans (strain DSM 15698 / JCM 12110 / HB-1) TaxID=648996 RepID=E8T2T8_THEA1|nr:6-carboxytetrahydropterin synthase [Thermovibrio ammonificans]ADU97147.1 6-pyruvoyl tetrahydropterin synthase and hypothetical protein [Thermovibrio ammonificans HB-1]